MSNYKEIGKRSFKSKWKIYLFHKVINSELDKINYSDFKMYELSNEAIRIYANEYWQEFSNHKINGKEISDIYDNIKNYESIQSLKITEFQKNYVEREFPHIFNQQDFEKLKQIENCKYCGITKEEINELGTQQKLRKKNLRGWNLEIDRLEPNKEYSKKNCVMSCYWCNNAKTDEFSEVEFMTIGKEIGIALRNRLQK